MIDLSQVAGFDWDDGNDRKSLGRHDVTSAEAEQVFVDRHMVVTDDVRHSQGEARYHALGKTLDGRLLHVTFTLRDHQTTIRVISARDANRKERPRYE
jgi:uncharacterized protein